MAAQEVFVPPRDAVDRAVHFPTRRRRERLEPAARVRVGDEHPLPARAGTLLLRERLRCGADVLEEVNLTREPQAMTEFLKLTGGRRIVPVMVKGAVIEIAPDGGTEF